MKEERLQAIKDNNFSVAGVMYNYEAFLATYASGDVQLAEVMLETLDRKGQLNVLELKTKEQKVNAQIAKEEKIREAAEMLILEDESQKDYDAQRKREGKLTYPGIELEFAKILDANKFMQWCMQTLRIKEVSIIPGVNVHKVQVKNITDDEYKAISKYYTTMTVTHTIQKAATKTMKSATDSIDFAAKNVIAPVTDIGIKSMSNVFKTVAALGTRIGATTVTSVATGIQQTKEEIVSDPEVIKAASTLIDAKDGIVKMLNSKTGMKKGITFIQ